MSSAAPAAASQRLHRSSNKSHSNKMGHNSDNSSGTASHQQHDGSNHVDKQPTQEQARIAQLMNDSTDLSDLQSKVEKIVELTKSTQEQAVVALHDCENDLERAITSILEGDVDDDDEWKSVSNRKPKKTAVKDTVSKKDHSENHKKSLNGNEKPQRGIGNGRGGDRGTFNKGSRDDRRENKERPPRIRNDENKDRNDGRVNDEPLEGANKFGSGRGRGDRPMRGSFTGERGRGGGRGLGRGATTSRGGRGGLAGRGGGITGGRTFRPSAAPESPPVIDDSTVFPNSMSIDTWNGGGADGSSAATAAPAAPLAVGNWSDVVGNNEDHWSEEDYEANLVETKVFTPSSAKSGEHSSNLASLGKTGPQQLPSVDMASLLKGPSASGPTQKQFSGVLAGQGQQQTRNAVGAALLQSLQQQPTSHGAPIPPPASAVPPPTQLNQGYGNQQQQQPQSFTNKQAADSIKNLVGISSTGGYAGVASGMSSQTRQGRGQPPLSDHSKHQNQQQQQRFLNPKKSGKIPESAVEMPTSDSISSLGVQFGALDFAADSNMFGLQQGIEANSNYDTNHVNKTPVKSTPISDSNSNNLRNRSPLNPYRPPQNVERHDQNKTSDLLKNMGHQGLNHAAVENVLSSSGNKGSAYANKVGLSDPQSKSDFYSTTTQQPQSIGHGDLNSYKVPYNTQGSAYGMSGVNNYAGVAATSAPYVYSSAGPAPGYGGVPNYGMSAYQNASQKNLSSGLKDSLDTSQQSKTSSYDLHAAAGLVNSSTMTTNVLKNSLSATGSKVGMPNVPQGMPTQMIPQQYIMPGGAFAYAPVYGDPSMSMAGGRADPSFAAYQQPSTTDVKYSRADASVDVSSVSSVSSQAPVSQTHSHPFLGQLPPGYGYFFTPMQAGMYPQPTPVFPGMSPASGTGASGAGFAKGSSPYGSHAAYGSAAYDPSGLSGSGAQDYSKGAYGQGGQQQSKSNLGNSSGDGMSSQYGQKSHSQMKQSYDKLAYQSGAPQQFNMSGAQSGGLGSASYAPNQYMVPLSGQALNLQHGLQGDVSGASGQGGGMSGQGSGRSNQSTGGGGGSRPSYGNYGNKGGW